MIHKRKKIDRLNFIKIKHISFQKILLREWKDSHKLGENVSKIGLTSRIYSDFLKLNSKKSNNQIKSGQKTCTESLTLPKKIYGWQISTWKEAHNKSWGKYKLKAQWDTVWPIRMHKAKHLTILSAGKVVEYLGTLIHCWWKCKNGTVTLENSLAVC